MKIYNPTSPGQRGKVGIDRSGLWSGSPFKPLTIGVANTGGRNNNGHMTVRHRAANVRKVYRLVDFSRKELAGLDAKVLRIEHDPNRTGFIALVSYEKDGKVRHSYVIAPNGLKEGDVISTASGSSEKLDLKSGNTMQLGSIRDGSLVHNIELKPGRGGILARSAGASAQVLGQDMGKTIVRLPSGELRYIRSSCIATIGRVSNVDHANIMYGKAGSLIHKGRRPMVRGIAKNPVDHPHGGKANGGMHPVSPWGWCTKGMKTRKKRSSDRDIIKRRRK